MPYMPPLRRIPLIEMNDLYDASGACEPCEPYDSEPKNNFFALFTRRITALFKKPKKEVKVNVNFSYIKGKYRQRLKDLTDENIRLKHELDLLKRERR